MSDVKPLPCPFCGGEATAKGFAGNQLWRWKCRSCDSCGPVRTDETEALTAWNRRAGPAWQPIATAPEHGDFWAWNAMTGEYRTRKVNGVFPMHGWDQMPGIWYPSPTHWQPRPAPPEDGE